MYFVEIKLIPSDVWEKLVPIVLQEIRAEKGIPDWRPKLLNGSYEFEKRMIRKYKELQGSPDTVSTIKLPSRRSKPPSPP